MQLKTKKLTFFDQIELKQATYAAKTFPMHFHDTVSIGIVERGVEQLCFNEKEIITPANSVIIINAFDNHANSSLGESVHYKTIYLNSEAMQWVFSKVGIQKNAISFAQNTIDDAFLFQKIQNFHAENQSNEQVLNEILAYIGTNYVQSSPEETPINNSEKAIIESLKYKLSNDLFEKINLDDLAKQYKMSKFKLIRLFKTHTGLTPIAYHLVCRINQSKHLFFSDLSLTEIGLNVGFYDQSHFIHCFKKYIGVTPSEYKNALSPS
jgi:AraC-like DNA-binding protein